MCRKAHVKTKQGAKIAMAFLLPGQFVVWVELIRKRAPPHTTCSLPFSLENAFTVCCLSACPVSCCFRMLWMHCETNATCTALPRLGIRHCKKLTGTKHIQTLFYSHCWSCANMLAADNTRFVFSQLKCSHNPTKLRSICLDRRMCRLSYQGQSVALSLGRAPFGWHNIQHSGDMASGSNPQRLLAVVFSPCNTKNKHKCVAWAMQLLHQLWARCYFVPRLYILYSLIQERAQ